MKVRMVVTVDVDPVAWDQAYGTGLHESDVRKDVRTYFDTHIGGAPAIEEAGLTVVVKPR